ncbi:MAG TPA: DUF1499 domain-containing protein [Usitatibacteraceae bacterium]|nr:DUF1499 domain-containing protein [Usitatibacteraceae bacterium]
MTGGGWRRRAAVALAAAVLAATAVALAGPAVGLFSGSRPDSLGFAGGRFAPGDWRPNWVSSTIARDDARHFVAPLAIAGDPSAAWAALEVALAAMPRATIVTRSPGYLHVEFASKGLGFVDDAEFALDGAAGVIHVKSAARLGIRDFSVNRDRVEAIRAALARRPA